MHHASDVAPNGVDRGVVAVDPGALSEANFRTERDIRAGVAHRAALGAEYAAAAASRIVTIADSVDSFLYGKRAAVFVGSAAVGVLSPTATKWFDIPLLEPVALSCFVVVGAVLALARVAMFRDDKGRWRASVGIRKLRDALGDTAQAFARFKDAPRNRRFEVVGRVCTSTALVVLALRSVFEKLYQSGFDSWEFEWSQAVDWFVFSAGLALWLGGIRGLHEQGKRGQLLVDPKRQPERARAVASAFSGLPAIVDCLVPEDSDDVRTAIADPLVRRLLHALEEWSPRRADDEAGYQRSLVRHLSRVIPETEAAPEVPLRSQGIPYFGRIDILFGRCVLIEMKRKLTTSTAHRAIGQIEMYGNLWASRGPVVLLLCETDAEPALALLESSIGRLRDAGHAVVAIRAGI